MHEFRPWADLPTDILSSISDRLGIIELLCFRGTCKDFRSASSTASAKKESSRTPWLLFPESDSSNCIIYNPHESKMYNKNIPELQGVKFLASYQGWLLLYKEKSVFFFCPFSGAKIVLPNIPYLTNNYGAAFSDLPTSPHCTVSIMMSSAVYVISKGQSKWACHWVPKQNLLWSLIDSTTFDHKSKKFYYMDGKNSVVTSSVKDEEKWNCDPLTSSDGLPYSYVRNPFREMAGFDKEHFHSTCGMGINVCGITFHEPITSRQLVYMNENWGILLREKDVKSGVWIQPRFFEANPNQHW